MLSSDFLYRNINDFSEVLPHMAKFQSLLAVKRITFFCNQSLQNILDQLRRKQSDGAPPESSPLSPFSKRDQHQPEPLPHCKATFTAVI
jgi:hypothetical protein